MSSDVEGALKRTLAAAASGAMLGALFPKLGLSFLAWVALVPLILVARAARPRAAAGYGFLAGVVFFAILMEWVRIFDDTGWIAAACFQGVYLALFAWIVRVISPAPRGWRGALLPAAAWTAVEWVRSLGPGGFTWGDLAYALHGHLPLMQWASVVGPFGLSLLVALANSTGAALASALLARRLKLADAAPAISGSKSRRAPERDPAGAPPLHGIADSAGEPPRIRSALGWMFAVALIILAAWIWGRWRLEQPVAGGDAVRVAVLQGSVSGEGTRDSWDLERTRQSARIYLHLTEQAAREGAKLIVWPESAVPGPLLLSSDMADISADIAAAVSRLRVDVLVGSAHCDPAGRRLNSAFLFTPRGAIGGRYDKVHLVPYGEYTPWRERLDFLYRRFPIIDQDVSPGAGFFALHADAAPLGVAICFESAFPSIARALRNSGAEILAVITNDAWFYYHSATWQHYHMAAFRAIENGTYLLRAATTGFSAIIDPYGREVAKTRLFARGILVADVRRMPRRTPYARFGDVVGWGCALGILALLLVEGLRGAPRR